MSEEINEGQVEGGEVEVDTEANAQLEQQVGEKMAKIFGDNEARNQSDESEQTGNETPENPDGLNVEEAAAQDTAEKEMVAPTSDDLLIENATVEELQAARDEAVAKGDYETAIELRDKIKEVQAAVVTDKPATKADKGVFSADERGMLKAIENWTDEDLNILEKNPEFARMTYRRVQNKYNELSLKYAQDATRAAPGQPQTRAEAATSAQSATLESLYSNLDKFAEVAGSEVVEQFIRPLKSEVLDPLKEVVAFVNESRQRAVADETNRTMSGIAVGNFADVYGKPDSLTNVQQNNRSMLYDAADRIIAGAKQHKVPMTIPEALNRAHLMLTARQQIADSKRTARKELVAQVKRRSTQITSRPSQRLSTTAVRSTKAAEANVEKFWENQAEA